MTEIGNSILREYVSEVEERVEDDKNRLRVGQGLSIAHSIWNLFILAINLFFLGFLVFGVVVLLSLDAAALDSLRSLSNEDILSAITTLSRFVQIFILVGLVATSAFGVNKYFRNIKQERLEREQERLELMRTIVQINEEVLKRHGLIKEEVIGNE